MGLIIHDNLVVNEKTNLALVDIYVNVKDVVISKDVIYKIYYQYQYYCNKQCRDNGKDALLIDSTLIECQSGLPANIYDAIYADLKSKYSSYSDD
jgi:hypothetical protein